MNNRNYTKRVFKIPWVDEIPRIEWYPNSFEFDLNYKDSISEVKIDTYIQKIPISAHLWVHFVLEDWPSEAHREWLAFKADLLRVDFNCASVNTTFQRIGEKNHEPKSRDNKTDEATLRLRRT
mgnify:FL=1